ncbi:MAG: hypothetical protein NVS4B8_26150 [Herpetosiphon sp.]
MVGKTNGPNRRAFLRAALCTATGVVVESCSSGASIASQPPTTSATAVSSSLTTREVGTGMRLEQHDAYLDVLHGNQLAGRYQFRDPFKPHLHPLNTPQGLTLSLASPHDHKHHKGLMYALRARDVNFWEESPTLPGELVGVQRHERFDRLIDDGETVGFDETLTWLAEDGTHPTFIENRSLRCVRSPDTRGFIWTWTNRLAAQRDLELIKSQWSWQKSDGTRVNYHGLGIRFRREFGCTGGNHLRIDGTEVTWADGLGRPSTEATFIGSIDGTFPPPMAGVSIRQNHNFALFVLAEPFAYMGFGPTNLTPVALAQGALLEESFTVTVFDQVP